MSKLKLRENHNVDSVLGLSKIITNVLHSRGFDTEDKIKSFLNPTLKQNLPNPALMKDAENATSIIIEAINNDEPITVYCDYDVDGLTSCSQLYLYLKALGAHVDTYATNRFVDGYGLSDIAVDKIAKGNTKLLITVDCGISNITQVSYARRNGLKVIVIDHHQPGEKLPNANAIVNPAQDGCSFGDEKLAAAGVVWMMIVNLSTKLDLINKKIDKEKANPKNYLDLAALGTICDMVPLKNANRLISRRGIEKIKKTSRVGIQALREVAGVTSDSNFGCSHISFSIGPRINAAGRLGDASSVIELLTTNDVKRASKIAKKIDKINLERRTIEESVRNRCLEQIGSDDSAAYAIYDKSFHAGVIGIAAQRIVEKHYRPAAVMAEGEQLVDGEMIKVIKGSVRSVKGFHVAENLFKLSNILINSGGHSMAGGFSLMPENLEIFQKSFIELASNAFKEKEPEYEVLADLELELSEINIDLVDQIQYLAPFGIGNPSVLFVSKNVEVISTTGIGQNHIKLKIKQNDSIREAIAWNQVNNPNYRKSKKLNIAYKPQINSYNGINNLQLHIKESWAV